MNMEAGAGVNMIDVWKSVVGRRSDPQSTGGPGAVVRGLLRDPHSVKTAAVALGIEMEMPGAYRVGY